MLEAPDKKTTEEEVLEKAEQVLSLMGEFRESVSGDPTMGCHQPQRECVW